jgi:hypothetical protein
MTNPTSNFGWQMPTSTDLVTDLPADFEVFGQAVDTSLADLKGGTTGQILAKASNTNMDFTWVTNDVGDITAVTAGTGISGGGASGDVTITNSMATAMTTKGDLVPATGSGAFARLGVGANNTVLTADSSTATGLKWATAGGGDDGPTFGVKRTTRQSVSSGTWTVVQFNVEDFDTNSNYNTSTYKFTPTVAGYYQINLSVGGTGTTVNRAMIAKNGTFTAMGNDVASTLASVATVIVYMNGSTDYVEAQCLITSGGLQVLEDIYTTYFSGALIRKA